MSRWRVELAAILDAVKERRLLAIVAIATIAAGIGLGIAGYGTSAAVICVGIALCGFIDRRLPILMAILLLPSLTAFYGLPIARIAGSILDFRLVLTGGIVLAIGCWLLVDRFRPDRVGVILLAFLAVLVILAPLNTVAPLKALPPIGRWAAYAAAYFAARRWLGTVGGFGLVLGAVVIGMALPTISGLVQLIAGTVAASTGNRITGIYQTSPVGLALAMQLPALALAASSVARRRPTSIRGWLGVALMLTSGFVLVETATRLVYASFVAALILIEILYRRPKAIPAIVAGAFVVLLLQSSLLGRIASAIPQPIPTADAQGQIPGDGTTIGGEVTISDPSLRFRLYVWGSMLPSWTNSPIVGHGTGSFATLFEAKSGLARIAPHNDYLGLLVETGIVGLGAYLILQAAVVWPLLRRSIRSQGTGRIIAITALVEFVALDLLNAINNPTLFLDLQVAVWALVGSALAAGHALEDASDAASEQAVASAT
jgi:O-antigen ligase